MTISTLKELEKAIKLMRKTGVYRAKIDGIELELGAEPIKSPRKTVSPTIAPGGIMAETQIPIERPTEEELLYWSAPAGEGS